VAAGLSGPARASAGAVRDFVLGVRLINGRGQHLTFGGQVMKNVAGYDVSRLMVGAMGSLGLLTEISLKVLPIAPAEATLMCADLTQQQALDMLHRWGAQPLPLNASCWVFDETASPPRNYLFVRLRGAVAAVEAACPRLMADVHAQGGAAQRMDNNQAQADWQSCRDHKLPFFQPPSADLCLWRLSLPQTAPVLDLPYAQLVEWHGAQRWLWAPWKAHTNIRQMVSAVGGTACVFRLPASQNAKSVERFQALSPALLKIHLALKAEFDPDGIFNRGRIHNQY
jgi:glycolate oxidase FAD binding subunit